MCYFLSLMQTDVNFIKTNFQEQIKALEFFFPFIDDAVKQGVPYKNIAFGGGTALSMYYLKHRLSYDIDLFLNDVQYISYFSPKFWINDCDKFYRDYNEQPHHIRLKTLDSVKIDILVCQNINDNLLENSHFIFDKEIYIHSIEDIIANKIIFRKEDNKARDIFDIVASLEKYPNLISDLLNKEAINIDDLHCLKASLMKLNFKKYMKEIAMIEPSDCFKHLALESPKILSEYIDKILKNPTHIEKTSSIQNPIFLNPNSSSALDSIKAEELAKNKSVENKKTNKVKNFTRNSHLKK